MSAAARRIRITEITETHVRCVEIDDEDTGVRPIVREPRTRMGRFAQVFALLSDTLGRDAAAREASRVVRSLPARGSR